jgi:hypothetical protein
MQVADLDGFLLDYWAALANEKWRNHRHEVRAFRNTLGETSVEIGCKADGWGPWSPATLWQQAGPIVTRERIETVLEGDHWEAIIRGALNPGRDSSLGIHTGVRVHWRGRSRTVAAMRAFVASRFGNEVPDLTFDVSPRPAAGPAPIHATRRNEITPMDWTLEPPTAEGAYWVRRERVPPELVHIRRWHDFDGQGRDRWEAEQFGKPDGIDLRAPWFAQARWLGPLLPPSVTDDGQL